MYDARVLEPSPPAVASGRDARGAGELWKASAFAGAELPYSELLRAGDGVEQRELTLAFLCERPRALRT